MEKPIYFKSLNGIRAIAALIVVIWHTDQFSRLFNIETFGFHTNGMADYAVNLFFVLSGFLITYLLLVEKNKTSTIDLKKFYLRRIFRIWPLYYLSIIISLFLIYLEVIPSDIDLTYSILLYVFLMANVAYVLNMAIATITPLWSVGVEEQFYLIWPHIIKKTKRYLPTFILAFVLFLALKSILYITLTPQSVYFKFLTVTRINIMCIGAIGAYLVYSKSKILLFIFRKEVQVIAWLVLLTSIFYRPLHLLNFIDKDLNSLFYLIIILNVSSNQKSLVSLENSVFTFLGKISYGIYVYHMLVIYSLSYTFFALNIELNAFLMYTLILGCTIIISWLSYRFFELPFLKIKNKYAVVKSTNSSSLMKQ